MNKYIRKHGRRLDILHCNTDTNDQEIIAELKKYQNEDGGFGHGLELDIQSPLSNIPSTNTAIEYLKNIKNSEEKTNMIKGMIAYYEKTFDVDNHRWYMVEEAVNDYPRAVWWNYENNKLFGPLNPTPEILGFLYNYKEYVSSIDLKKEIRYIISLIKNKFGTSESFHEGLSIARFITDIPYVASELKPLVINKLREFLLDDTDDYHLRPYQVALIDKQLVPYSLLVNDLISLESELKEKGYIECPWSWFQYEEEFNKVKPYWNALLTKNALKALDLF